MTDDSSRSGHPEPEPRQDVVAQVVAELNSGLRRGVVIVGSQGVGKSFIAQRALDELHEDYFVVQVRGSSVSSALEYGALSILLNDVDGQHLQHPVMVLQRLTQLLHKRAQGRNVLLFVDNAHYLDDLSAMVIAQLTAGGHVRLLAVCRELKHAGGDLVGLWKDDLLLRVDLGVLDHGEAAAILVQDFGGLFSQTALRALWNASGGNVLILLALAKEQIRQGILTRHEGVWILRNSPIAFTGEIREIAKSRLNLLSPGQRDVVELLALAGALPLPTLMRAVQANDVDSLQELSVLEVTAGQPPMVRITEPVIANVVAGFVPPGRSTYLRSRLANASASALQSASQPVRDVAWALDCGEPVTAEQAIAAAKAANRMSDGASALRFLREIDQFELASAAGTESIIAHLGRNGHERGRELVYKFDAAISRDLPLSEWTALQLVGTVLDRRSRITHENAKLRLKEIGTRLSEHAASSETGLSQFHEQLRLAEAYVASFEGRHQDVLTLLPNLEIDEGSNEDALAAASLRCVSNAALGDMRQAADAAIPIELAIRSDCVSDHTAREIRGNLLQVLLLCGEFGICKEYLAMILTSDEAPSRLGGIAEIIPGLIELHQGNTKGATTLLEAGARQLNYQDEDALRDLATASCAFASALQGDAAKTDMFLAQIGQGTIPAPWLTGRLTRYYELRARGERGNESDLARLLLKEADTDAGVSAVAPALQFLVAAGCHSPGVGDKLCDLAKTARGSFADLCSKLGKGMKENDNQLLLALCRQAQQSGNAILARDIARFSVSHANSSGDRLAIRAAHRVQQTLEEFFRRSVNDPDTSAISTLTTRECEIATAAAAGISNRRIAEQMHVSVRTVEGHLYQVYAKLHVAGRAELRDLMNTGTGGTEAGTAEKGKTPAL